MKTIQQQLQTLTPSRAGQFLYYCLPFRRRVVLNNIQQVFSNQLSAAEQKKLAQCFYSHIATSIKENILLRFMNQQQICQRATVRGHEKVIEIAEKTNRGVLILTGHFGNWEFAPIAGIMNFQAFQGRFHIIRKTLKAKWLEKILFRRYYKAGLQVIPKKNSLNQVCEVLEKQNAVVFVMDQHASLQAKDGIAVEFFGKKAGTYRSLAMIARNMSVPVIPAITYREADGQHVFEFLDPIPWQHSDDRKQEIYLNTLAYNQALEKMVLAKPEQWLWMHKRWKTT